jgi:putative nucleotidyltransferase with HDIG domain
MSSEIITSKHKKQSLHIWSGLLFSLCLSLLSELILGTSFGWIDVPTSVARVCALLLTCFIIHRFALRALPSFALGIRKNLFTLGIILLGTVSTIWLGRIFAYSIAAYSKQSNLISTVSPDSVLFAIPWSTGVLIIQAIIGIEYALVASLITALFAGMYFEQDAMLVPYVLCSTLVAALSLVKFRSRSSYIRAGISVALVTLPLTITSFLLTPEVSPADVPVRILAGFSSGIIAAFLAAGITPLFEYFGDYVTDMRLIELATLDHPLLKELSVQAPGTWNHSMVMGMMAESAAEAVGANSVIARVGAYFHDIGKLKKPLYFVENQAGEENRHDKLSPSMSALIIRSHVKDGLEMAKKHHLPLTIQDMIPQHHGTSVIEYFYDKALKEAKELGLEAETVDKSLYTYPGPRPQTKEAGILMLADSIEAAARTLPDPTADRIQGMVQKLINKIFSSGQLNECQLTLQELHRIAKCFTRVLTGIYHQRIAYAEPAEKIKDVESDGHQKKTVERDSTTEDKKDRSEDLKRLGIENGTVAD